MYSINAYTIQRLISFRLLEIKIIIYNFNREPVYYLGTDKLNESLDGTHKTLPPRKENDFITYEFLLGNICGTQKLGVVVKWL